MRKPTYSIEVGAKLIVRLDNGQEHEATEEDARRFGLIDPLEAYRRFYKYLEAIVRRDLTETPINPIRYLAECAICYDHMPEGEDDAAIREVLRKLGVWAGVEDDVPQRDSHGRSNNA